MRGKDCLLDRVNGIRLPVGSDLTQVSAHQGSSSSSKVTLPHSGSSLSVRWPSLRGILPQPHPILLRSSPSLAHGPWCRLGCLPVGPAAAFGACGTLTSGTLASWGLFAPLGHSNTVVPVPANPGQLVMADLPGVGLLGLWVPQRPWSQLGWCCVPMPLLLRIARISYVVFRHTMWRWLQGSPGRRRSPHLPSLLPLDRPPACCLWEEPGPALLRC